MPIAIINATIMHYLGRTISSVCGISLASLFLFGCAEMSPPRYATEAQLAEAFPLDRVVVDNDYIDYITDLPGGSLVRRYGSISDVSATNVLLGVWYEKSVFVRYGSSQVEYTIRARLSSETIELFLKQNAKGSGGRPYELFDDAVADKVMAIKRTLPGSSEVETNQISQTSLSQSPDITDIITTIKFSVTTSLVRVGVPFDLQVTLRVLNATSVPEYSLRLPEEFGVPETVYKSFSLSTTNGFSTVCQSTMYRVCAYQSGDYEIGRSAIAMDMTNVSFFPVSVHVRGDNEHRGQGSSIAK